MASSIARHTLALYVLIFQVLTSAQDYNGGTPVATRLLWASPIAIVDVSSNDRIFNRALRNAALHHFGGLSYNETLRSILGVTEPASNQQFFVWQQRWKRDAIYKQRFSGRGSTNSNSSMFARSPEFGALVAQFEAAARRYLTNLGAGDAVQAGGAVDCWSSVHGDGSWHPPHHHYVSTELVSGVFYAAVPRDNGASPGAIVFSDPRGTMPPLGQTHSVAPQEGMLVLFPSWLSHTVEPSVGGGWEPAGGNDVTSSDRIGVGVSSKVSAEVKVVLAEEGTSLEKMKTKKERRKGQSPVFFKSAYADLEGSFRVSFSCNFHAASPADVSSFAGVGLAV